MSEKSDQTIRLLLVDDEEAFVAVLSKRLARRNVIVTPAYNGTEAIQRLRREDFDVAVLDLKMEEMDGIEVLKVFQKMAPELPVIMLTGHGCQVAAREGKAYGAYDYLSKPYDFEHLLEKIQEAFQSRRGEK
jgi:DNA-binding NtrC family response regulator